MSEPNIFSRVEAILMAAPEPMESHFRELRLMMWDHECEVERELISLFQPHDEPVPQWLKVGRSMYRQGQTSGPSNYVVWFEREENF